MLICSRPYPPCSHAVVENWPHLYGRIMEPPHPCVRSSMPRSKKIVSYCAQCTSLFHVYTYISYVHVCVCVSNFVSNKKKKTQDIIARRMKKVLFSFVSPLSSTLFSLSLHFCENRRYFGSHTSDVNKCTTIYNYVPYFQLVFHLSLYAPPPTPSLSLSFVFNGTISHSSKWFAFARICIQSTFSVFT